jgi:hypothetical protein
MISTAWIARWFCDGLSMATISTLGGIPQSTVAAVIGQYIDREHERLTR